MQSDYFYFYFLFNSSLQFLPFQVVVKYITCLDTNNTLESLAK